MPERLKMQADTPRYDTLAASAHASLEAGNDKQPPAAGAAGVRRALLVRNAGWSILGQVLPGVAALVSMPFIVHGFGDARFGLLTLAWMIVGYFSLFDFGLGRAVTQGIAESLAAKDDERTSSVFWTSTYLLMGLGLLGMIVLGVATPWIVERGLDVPIELRGEARQTLLILALSIPLVVLSTGWRGVIEGAQRFGWSTAIRVPMGVLGFLLPLVALQFSSSLIPTIWLLLGLRAAAALAFWILCRREFPALRHVRRYSAASARSLLRFGAWITVSNIISPLMVSMDRFVVGATLSLAMVTYYATPFEAITRLSIIPSAIGAVIFPALAAARMEGGDSIVRIYQGAIRAVFVFVFPVALLIVTLAPELLSVWLGAPFPERSTIVLRWLTLGVVVNALAHVPYALLQSMGRADLTARAHLVEFPAYLVLIFTLIQPFGIAGAAAAWTARVVLDCGILLVLAGRVAKREVHTWSRDIIPMTMLIAAGAVSVLLTRLDARLAWAGLIAMVFGIVTLTLWAGSLASPALRSRLGMSGARG